MKKKIIICTISALAIASVLIGAFVYYHPTHFKFNDRFILGNSSDEIVEKYGEYYQTRLNEKGEIACGIYMLRDNTPELVMSYDDSLWYEIYFENGIAVSVKLREGRYGG